MCVSLAQDESASFARLLQEQERAYYMMQFDGAAAAEEDAGGDATPVDEEEDESLALARQLQEDEEREYRNRMLAMAGIDPENGDDSEAEGLDTDAMTYEELCDLGEQVGKVVCGLTDAQTASLPGVKIDSRFEGTRCAVCCVEFDLEEEACQLPRCKHVYHRECVEPWFKENKACPTCKMDVFEEK